MATSDEFYKAINEFISKANAPRYSRPCEQCASAIRFVRIQRPWEKNPRLIPLLKPKEVK